MNFEEITGAVLNKWIFTTTMSADNPNTGHLEISPAPIHGHGKNGAQTSMIMFKIVVMNTLWVATYG
jgi:hypothetical protein